MWARSLCSGSIHLRYTSNKALRAGAGSRILPSMTRFRIGVGVVTSQSGPSLFHFPPQITVARAWSYLVPPSELKEIALGSLEQRDLALAVLNSSLFYWFFCVYSDVRNVNRREIDAFPCSLE